MKILHIINTMKLGGAQSLLVSLTKEQKASGDEVKILQLVPSKDKTLIDQVEANGVPVLTLSKGGSIYSPLKVFFLIKYIKSVDIVHVHLFPAQYWVAIAKMMSRTKTPLVTTEHSTQNKRRKKRFWKIVDTWVYKKYRYVVACADKALETFKRDYPSGKINTTVIPNGIDVKRYHEALPYTKQALLGVSNDTFIITMIARFIYPKRQDVLVKSLHYLPNNCHVALVGGCDHNDEGLDKVRQLANNLGLSERVHFLYSRKDVPQILKSSDVIVMSSEYEGLSLSSLEGMAAGVFVASDVNGLREVVEGAGVLFKSGDEKDLSRVINNLIINHDDYVNIKERCYKKAINYDVKIMASKYRKVYEEC